MTILNMVSSEFVCGSGVESVDFGHVSSGMSQTTYRAKHMVCGWSNQIVKKLHRFKINLHNRTIQNIVIYSFQLYCV